jgi:hypothetical protein
VQRLGEIRQLISRHGGERYACLARELAVQHQLSMEGLVHTLRGKACKSAAAAF